MEIMLFKLFNYFLLKSREKLFNTLREEEEQYDYFCPKCETGINYRQDTCEKCKSTLTWFDNPEEKKHEDAV